MVSMAWLGEALKTLNRPMHEHVGPFGNSSSGIVRDEERKLLALAWASSAAVCPVTESPGQEVGARESVTTPLHYGVV
jgi:hypothetical protein